MSPRNRFLLTVIASSPIYERLKTVLIFFPATVERDQAMGLKHDEEEACIMKKGIRQN